MKPPQVEFPGFALDYYVGYYLLKELIFTGSFAVPISQFHLNLISILIEFLLNIIHGWFVVFSHKRQYNEVSMLISKISFRVANGSGSVPNQTWIQTRYVNEGTELVPVWDRNLSLASNFGSAN